MIVQTLATTRTYTAGEIASGLELDDRIYAVVLDKLPGETDEQTIVMVGKDNSKQEDSYDVFWACWPDDLVEEESQETRFQDAIEDNVYIASAPTPELAVQKICEIVGCKPEDLHCIRDD